MGLGALALYLLFLWTPLKGLRRITREGFESRRASRLYYLAAGIQASLVAYVVASFFASVAYYWNVYYLVGYAVCLRRLYEAERRGAAAGEAAAGEPAEAEAAPGEDFGGAPADARGSRPPATGV